MSDFKYTLDDLEQTWNLLKASSDYIETPVVECPSIRKFPKQVYLKLENLQPTGSFKIRGVINQFQSYDIENRESDTPVKLITMSAGNYGKSFASYCKKMQWDGVVCLPSTAPVERRQMLRDAGVRVEVVPSDQLLEFVQSKVHTEGYTFFHPFDDRKLILGYTSIAEELLKQLPASIHESKLAVIVPCGGGGLLAGVALGLRLLGSKAKVIGVEPANASGQYLSRKQQKPLQSFPMSKTIAAGLAAPMAGKECFHVIQEHVNDLVVVSDEEIKAGLQVLYDQGIVAEPSGAAGVAALVAGKFQHLQDHTFVCMVSGSNISTKELAEYCT